MGNLDEVQDCLDACYRVGNDQVVLLKYYSEYPAPWDNIKLGNILDMKERFNIPAGLFDHSAGSIVAVVGVSLGAWVIEKHVKIDKVDSFDSGFSIIILALLMDEFAQMVQECS